MCCDSTSVIWCLRVRAPVFSQWAFLGVHSVMAAHQITVRWSPGHAGIQGNERADQLAGKEAKSPQPPFSPATQPTVSSVESVSRGWHQLIKAQWWSTAKSHNSSRYQAWDLPYTSTRANNTLSLSQPTLSQLLSIRTSHGDFS